MSTELPLPEQPVVMDVPGWQGIHPGIPDTPQRRKLHRQRDVREIVFGAKDGILTTMGVVTGVGAASGDHGTVAIAGLLALIAGALSMGVGQYQGTKSEREVVRSSIEQEKAEMAAHPQDEFAEQVAYYKLKGFSADEAHLIVNRLVRNPEIYLYEMVRDEFGIDPRIADDSDVRPAFAIAGSYAVGSFLPVVPFIPALSPLVALVASGVLALLGLFGIGFYAGSMTTRNPWKRGLEIVLWGSGVFAISFLAGRFIPPLLGHAFVPIGG